MVMVAKRRMGWHGRDSKTTSAVRCRTLGKSFNLSSPAFLIYKLEITALARLRIYPVNLCDVLRAELAQTADSTKD